MKFWIEDDLVVLNKYYLKSFLRAGILGPVLEHHGQLRDFFSLTIVNHGVNIAIFF